MTFLQFTVTIVLIFSHSLRTVSACNGYSLKVNHARNCMTGGVMELTGDNGGSLDKDCNLSITGCMAVTKTYKTHLVKYTIKKAPMPPIEGEIEACEALAKVKDQTILDTMKVLSVPSSCPVEPQKICSTGKSLNLSKFKNQLGMAAGTVDVRLEGTHDSGKSCIEINFTLAKEKRAG